MVKIIGTNGNFSMGIYICHQNKGISVAEIEGCVRTRKGKYVKT